MFNISDMVKEFKFGGIERIFICFYSYFIVGYFILFVIYENSFINLQFSTQIILAIAISFPTVSIPVVVEFNKSNPKTEVDPPKTEGLFYMATGYYYATSIYYTVVFSLFYLLKHLELIDTKFDPVIGLVLIVLYFIKKLIINQTT